MINFDVRMQAKMPLSHPSKLGRRDFPVPFSFFFGENDWVQFLDEGGSQELLKNSKFKESKYHTIPASDHNMHMDNPNVLAKAIIDDIFDGKRKDIESESVDKLSPKNQI